MSNIDLLTVADRVQLLVNAINGGDHAPVVKLFTPDAQATWLITEVDPDDPDRLFGLCDLGLASRSSITFRSPAPWSPWAAGRTGRSFCS